MCQDAPSDLEAVVVCVRYGWSLDWNDWDRVQGLTADTEERWHRVIRLDVHHDRMVPTEPGVYALCARPSERFKGMPTTLFGIVYVGQAVNLRSRYLQHCKTPSVEVQRAKECFGYNIEYWFLRLSADRLDSAESALIACLGPPANRVAGVIQAVIRPPVSI